MYFRKLTLLLPLAILLLITSCQDTESTSNSTTPPLQGKPAYSGASFESIPTSSSGVAFNNLISEDYNYNIFNFEYLYNGGGVAIGDINNDGLPDLYFTGTFVDNKLYLNKGNFKFEDITDKAGVAAKEGFKTGVTMADINGDGYLDIYVCRTSKTDDGKKNNHVFINNKDLTFTDQGPLMGLADNMNSNHATFFDYDLDGDLDLYLLNHRLDFTLAVKVDLKQDEQGNIFRKKDPISPFESDKLYQNNGQGKFVDVSKAAGINNSAFGLSATVADINQDGYPDVYVANDYIEPDYVYINNKNGTFTDQYEMMIRHSSQNSMGSDIADINNDGLPDVVVLDMIADDPIRYKQLMNVMVNKRYNALVEYGYGHQVSRNVLQLNNGKNGFSEIGQIAGVSNTDWSWGPLLADLDNDGWKDLYIANGYRKDVTNLDYMTYTRDSIQQTGGITPKRYPDLNEFMKIVPSKKLANYCFRNKGGWTFDNVGDDWGFSQTSFSNGAAYGDLDADGDLDIVVNNIDAAAFVYKNNVSAGNNYLQITAKGPAKNPKGYGLQAELTTANGTQTLELQSSRGFFSASEPLLQFGLGNATSIEKLVLNWPGGNQQILTNVNANQRLVADYKNSKKGSKTAEAKPVTLVKANNRGINFQHVENKFEDYNRETLLPSQLSKLGPHMSVGDVNKDKFEDLFIGGAANQPGAIFVQQKNGNYKKSNQPALTADAAYEDMGSVFTDVDNDGDEDLIIVSGGSAQPVGSKLYQDRLYLNDGQGTYSRSNNFPLTNAASSHIIAFDYDGDDDKDLFISGRCLPGSYPTNPKSYLLNNDGSGKFTDVSKTAGKELFELGMISTLAYSDLDGDTKKELILAGEWLPISTFSWNGTAFENTTNKFGLSNTTGWWNTLTVGDVDGDGDKDIIAGNLGKNSRLKASSEKPLVLFAKDFDRNGQVDPLLAFHHEGKVYPFAGRDQMVGQIAMVKKKYPRYAKYAKASMNEIFGEAALKDAQRLEANQFASQLFINDGNGKFSGIDLPLEAQVAPIMAAQIYNFDGKGAVEIFLTGNFSGAEAETGVYDAFNGAVLSYSDGNWQVLDPKQTGFWIEGEGRSITILNRGSSRPLMICTQNNGQVVGFERGSK